MQEKEMPNEPRLQKNEWSDGHYREGSRALLTSCMHGLPDQPKLVIRRFLSCKFLFRFLVGLVEKTHLPWQNLVTSFTFPFITPKSYPQQSNEIKSSINNNTLCQMQAAFFFKLRAGL